MLYSGPTNGATVVFPVGVFRLYAEIHEEAEAYTTFEIEPSFLGYLPTQQEYEAYSMTDAVAQHGSNQARVSQMLLADVSK